MRDARFSIIHGSARVIFVRCKLMYLTKKYQGKFQAVCLAVTGRQLATPPQKLQIGYACGSALGHTPVTSVREVAA